MSAVDSHEATGSVILQSWFHEALQLQRLGRRDDAQALYARILAGDPEHAGALHLTGAIAFEQGAVEHARDLFERSIRSNPRHAAAHADLGNALRLLGRIPESLACYDRAIALQPNFVAALFNSAAILLEQGRYEPALARFERLLKTEPEFVPALYNRAVLLGALHRREEALRAYERCLRVAPSNAEAWNNHGVLLLDLRRPTDAMASFERVLRLVPGHVQALNNRGNALRALDRLDDALADYDRALATDPRSLEALRNRGTVLHAMGRTDAALLCLQAARELQPDNPATLLELAQVLTKLHDDVQAIACLDRLIGIAPQTIYARGLRLHAQGLTCDWTEHGTRVRDVIARVRAGESADYPFPFLALSDNAAEQRTCARRFAHAQVASPRPKRVRQRPFHHRKIRVAYLSGDFRLHPVAALLTGVLEQHDRSRIESLAFSFRPPENSPMGMRIVAAFDEFVDASRMTDREAAELLRRREIDIAVDLMGYTLGSRPAILAQRAAPAQINFLGYPGTMGVDWIDYIVADRFVIPEASRKHYAEEPIYLPDSFQPNTRRAVSPRPARAQVGLPEFSFVFCCFNNNYKFNPEFFTVWTRLLKAVPNSVLWLFAEQAHASQRLAREASERGIDPRRLVFAPRIGYEDHLARLSCADLFLDTLPFNGGTTASDALWAGVPVLTCAGEAFAARMAGSLLHAVNLPELVTETLADYESMALRLAQTPALLAELRARLHAARDVAPLFDAARYCRHLEAAFESVRDRSERGLPPLGFVVDPLPNTRRPVA